MLYLTMNPETNNKITYHYYKYRDQYFLYRFDLDSSGRFYKIIEQMFGAVDDFTFDLEQQYGQFLGIHFPAGKDNIVLVEMANYTMEIIMDFKYA